jgi:hypothetical protein
MTGCSCHPLPSKREVDTPLMILFHAAGAASFGALLGQHISQCSFPATPEALHSPWVSAHNAVDMVGTRSGAAGPPVHPPSPHCFVSLAPPGSPLLAPLDVMLYNASHTVKLISCSCHTFAEQQKTSRRFAPHQVAVISWSEMLHNRRGCRNAGGRGGGAGATS